MQIEQGDRVLITGATGLVGSHVAEMAAGCGWTTRVLVRPTADRSFLETLGVEIVEGDLTNPESLRRATDGATVIIHCAAKVGDWGPTEPYREINVNGLRRLIDAARAAGCLKRFVHISSLGVYPARDHYGSDESLQPNTEGIDGYTLTKVEAEQVIDEQKNFPAVTLRPGFIYGPRDRTVLPRIFERLRDGKFAFLGSKQKLMNNTYVGNLCEAVSLAIERDDVIGQKFNIRDGRAVNKEEFIGTIAKLAGYKVPARVVPLPIARGLASVLEGLWKLLGKDTAPILSNARIKFLGLNLDYCIEKARHELGYDPQVDFAQGMETTVSWFREQNAL